MVEEMQPLCDMLGGWRDIGYVIICWMLKHGMGATHLYTEIWYVVQHVLYADTWHVVQHILYADTWHVVKHVLYADTWHVVMCVLYWVFALPCN